MPADPELTSPEKNSDGISAPSSPLCAMQAWLGDAPAGAASAAEQLRNFTREIREQEDPERWDGLS